MGLPLDPAEPLSAVMPLGSVMQQQQCTAEQAFDLLRRLSQPTNLKLRDVCTRLLTDIAGRPPVPSPPLRPQP
ncbi:ANTAR domain-containing protein [Streptomyces sp. NPDC007808]|uniref:ANTAR domain-containing protein n=1 Tax=Streptomyces sp. NPDC007808 TaxID=3364779 RepID=UPI0036BE4462